MSIKTAKRIIYSSALASTMIAGKSFAQKAIQNGVNQITPNGTSTTNLQTYVQTIINVLLSLIGVVAVIMLIYGGFRYVLSGGNEKSTKDARDTILFAIIGIVVAVLAFAIVNFVLGAFN